jgi:hypothetical protein
LRGRRTPAIIVAMRDQNRCPLCGPVPDQASSLHCQTHRRDLLAECESYVAAWATTTADRLTAARAA